VFEAQKELILHWQEGLEHQDRRMIMHVKISSFTELPLLQFTRSRVLLLGEKEYVLRLTLEGY
jgi:hypothetical protein